MKGLTFLEMITDSIKKRQEGIAEEHLNHTANRNVPGLYPFCPDLQHEGNNRKTRRALKKQLKKNRR